MRGDFGQFFRTLVGSVVRLFAVVLPLLLARRILAPELSGFSWVGTLLAAYLVVKVLYYPRLAALKQRFKWRREALHAAIFLSVAVATAAAGSIYETVLWLLILSLLSAQERYRESRTERHVPPDAEM